jgi:hypothetical protein
MIPIYSKKYPYLLVFSIIVYMKTIDSNKKVHANSAFVSIFESRQLV